MSSNSQELAPENALNEIDSLDIHFISEIQDYVVQMRAVNLRLERINGEFAILATIEPDPERFLAVASEFIDSMALMEKLDDDLESIAARNNEWRDALILLLNSMAPDSQHSARD